MDAIATTAVLDCAEQHFAAPRLAEAEMLFRRKTGVSGDDVYQTSLMTTHAVRRL